MYDIDSTRLSSKLRLAHRWASITPDQQERSNLDGTFSWQVSCFRKFTACLSLPHQDNWVCLYMAVASHMHACDTVGWQLEQGFDTSTYFMSCLLRE